MDRISIKVGQIKIMLDLDSYTDNWIIEKGKSLVIYNNKYLVNVYKYAKNVNSISNWKIVSSVIAYDHPETGEEYILVIH